MLWYKGVIGKSYGIVISKGKTENEWIVKSLEEGKLGKIFFVKSLFPLRKGQKIKFYITREKEKYGFGKVRYTVDYHWNEKEDVVEYWICSFISRIQKITSNEEKILKINLPEVYKDYIELKKHIEERERNIDNRKRVIEKLNEIKNSIETRKVLLTENEVKFYGDIDISPVWYKSKEERKETSGYSYESKRGEKIEQVEEKVSMKLFKEGYATLLELLEEGEISGEELIKVWNEIVGNYILEEQEYVDKYGKVWKFKRLVRKENPYIYTVIESNKGGA